MLRRVFEVALPRLKLLADLAPVCREYQDGALRGLPCKRLQCDEIWSFCYAKAKNLPDVSGHPMLSHRGHRS